MQTLQYNLLFVTQTDQNEKFHTPKGKSGYLGWDLYDKILIESREKMLIIKSFVSNLYISPLERP